MYSIGSLSKEFVRNVVGATMAMLAMAVVFLWRENNNLQIREREKHGLIADIERRCAEEKDALRREQLQFIRESLERLQAIEKNKNPRGRSTR